MKSREILTYLLGAVLFLCSIFFVTNTVYGYYGCGGGPCQGGYPCNASPPGMTCNGSQICGQVYDACSGTTCGSGTGWDQSTCTVTSCTAAGTTNTASYGGWGACNVGCGLGTQYRTCNCNIPNNCATPQCSSPTKNCTEQDSQGCCISVNPQAPVVTGAGDGSCTLDGVVPVTWTFGTGGCGGAWGYACSSPSNTFYITDGGSTIASGILAGTSPYSNSVALSDGNHQIKACASNGLLNTCPASAYSTDISIDTYPPPVPNLSSTTSNCSGNISFSWPAVSDVGCFGGVDYWLQVKDNASNWYFNNWGATSAYTIGSPVVGRVYQAQVKSSDRSYVPSNQSAWSGDIGQLGESLWTNGVPYCCRATVAALAPLTPSGTCNGKTFPATYTWTADTNATGYYLNITGCLVDQWVAGGTTNSYTLSPGPGGQQATCASSIATGAVSWNVRATYAGGCIDSPAATANFTYDKSAPPIPVPTIRYDIDAACLGKYYITHSWQSVADVGCKGMNVDPYWSQASLNIGFPINVFPINTYGAYTSQQTSVSYVPGTVVYTHVQSKDAGVPENESGFAVIPDTNTIPVPTPYPTIHIAGTINEDIAGSCYPMDITSGLTLSPSFNPSTGVTYSCPTLTGTTYACNITVNNTSGLCVDPSVEVTMSGTYAGYTGAEWRVGDVCSGAPESRTFNVGDSVSNVPLYLTYVNTGGWFKLKDTSFNSRQSNRQNIVPNNVRPYDADDTDTSHNILSANSGLLVQDGDLEPGANAGGVYSTNNWFTSGYSQTNDISYSKYIDYIKTRKEFKSITNTDLSEIATDGIYSISSSVTIDALRVSQFVGKKVVLVVQGAGTATFTANFIPAGGSVAVLAKNIVIDPSVTEIDAILIGQTVDIGTSATNELKIKGNLIDESMNASALSQDRTRADGRIPSLFVVFNPQIYLDLLPYLSTSTYDWRQIQ